MCVVYVSCIFHDISHIHTTKQTRHICFVVCMCEFVLCVCLVCVLLYICVCVWVVCVCEAANYPHTYTHTHTHMCVRVCSSGACVCVHGVFFQVSCVFACACVRCFDLCVWICVFFMCV
jgi:hypothetical protein